MFDPKWLRALLILDRYRDRVFSCDTDLRNSSTQGPSRGDFDPWQTPTLFKDLCCPQSQELLSDLLIRRAGTFAMLSSILYVADPPDSVFGPAVASAVKSHLGPRKRNFSFLVCRPSAGDAQSVGSKNADSILSGKGPERGFCPLSFLPQF